MIHLPRHLMPALCLLILLTGCKAENAALDLTVTQILAAASGTPATLPFTATIAEQEVEVDDAKRATINAVASVIEAHFPNSSAKATFTTDAYSIEITGELQLSATQPASGAPWYLGAVRPSADAPVKVSLLQGAGFAAFAAALTGIDAMIGPDPFQPIEFRLSGDQATVFAGGATIDGTPETAAMIKLTGPAVSLGFTGGIWDQTGGGFLLFADQ